LISLNGSKLGSSSVAGYSGTVFEPIDEFKGDIARITLRPDMKPLFLVTHILCSTEQPIRYSNCLLNMLLAWNTQDPVNAREIARNNAIYATQNNRNPYIDHPEYVQQVWNPSADSQAPTVPTNLIASGTTDSTTNLSWTASTDNVE
jgi:endonuclease I